MPSEFKNEANISNITISSTLTKNFGECNKQNKQSKEQTRRKYVRIEKKKVKVLLFTEQLMVHIEHPK